MTIINATQYLKQLLSSSELNRIGKFTGFVSDSGISSLRDYSRLCSQGLVATRWMVLLVCIAHFNALQLHDTDQIAYKPFHNQLRKGFSLVHARTG